MGTSGPFALPNEFFSPATATIEQQQGLMFSKASEVPAHLHDAHHDSRRPIFHPQAARGWSSDPCGPIFYKGRYHLFYQHLRHSCQWYWGLCWDHLVSDDLIHWKNLPPAVVPTPGWFDADGCFSGTVEFDPELDVPVIMYTGVYLKANEACVQAHGVPPPEHDPGTRFVERQLAAVPADPDDPDLTEWVKLPEPVMYPAPAGLNISCWRDPFCLQRPGAAGGAGAYWVVLLASGIRGVGGAVLRFKSKHWTYGWEFDGLLAAGDNTALGIKGQDWECPILTKLPCIQTPPAIASLPEQALLASVAQQTQQSEDDAAGSDSNSSGSYVILQEDPQQQQEDDEVAAVADRGDSSSSSSTTSSVVIELVDAHTTIAAAAEKTGCLLGPTASQQLLLPKGKSFRISARIGSCNSLSSAAYSQNASTGSSLAVGNYPGEGLGVLESTAASTGFGSSVYHPDHMSEVASSAQISGSLNQITRDQKRSESTVCLSSVRSEDSFSMGDVCSISQVTAERLASAAAAAADAAGGSSSNSSDGSSGVTATSLAAAADAVAAAAAALFAANSEGTVAPLTEPVLEAVLMSAAAEGESSSLTEQHPSTNISVWLEQTADSEAPVTAAPAAAPVTSPPAAAAAAAAAVDELAAAAAAAADSLDNGGDLVVVVFDNSSPVGKCVIDNCSDVKRLKQQQRVAEIGAGSSSSSAPLTELTAAPASSSTESSSSSSKSYQRDWWFCMSPDACNNPITWWLGDYDGKRFDMAAADGPHRLDLGTTLYAASLWIDPQGRQLLYGWMQEHRRVPSPPNNCVDYSYAGCIGTPRVLQLVGGRLFQQPLREIDRLRTEVSWHLQSFTLSPHAPLKPLQVVSGTHLDINLALQPPAAAAAAISSSPCVTSNAVDVAPEFRTSSKHSPRVGIVFKSWRAEGYGAAVLSFDWSTHCLVFDFDEPFPDAYTPHPEDTPERRRVGGKLTSYEPGTPLSLRILLDGSAVEVFTSTGETLTTRMYRGHPPKCKCGHCDTYTTSSSSSSSVGVRADQQQQQSNVSDPGAVEDEADSSSSSSSVFAAQHQQQQQQQSNVSDVTADSAELEDETGIALFAAGAAVCISRVDVWEMGSCWVNSGRISELQQQQQQEYCGSISAALPPPAAAATPAVTPVYGALQEELASQKNSLAAAAAAAAATAAGRDRGEVHSEREEFVSCSSSDVGTAGTQVTGATLLHMAAGTQAQVAEDFLEDLNISSTTSFECTNQARSGRLMGK